MSLLLICSCARKLRQNERREKPVRKLRGKRGGEAEERVVLAIWLLSNIVPEATQHLG